MKNLSLLSYVKRYSGERDTISIYFELIDKESVIIHRYYYNFEKINAFFNDELDDKEKIDIRDAPIITKMDEFNLIFSKFINNSKLLNSLDIKTINNIKKSLVEETDINNKYKMIDELNSMFFGYQYNAIKRKHNKNCDLINRIEELIRNNKIGQVENDIKTSPKLPNEFKKNDLMQFRIYNVGQANCSALIKFKNDIKDDYDVVAVFDFGLQKSSRKNDDLQKMIDKINENTTIIISHFDSDHINNITAYDRTKTSRWLFPEHCPKSKKGNMLYAALLKIATKKSYSGKVYSYKTPYCMSSFLQIHQNTLGKIDTYQSTIENAQSIIATLKLGEKHILIPADALYKDFPKSVFDSDYTDIIIPHHCCHYTSKLHNPSDYPISKIVSLCKRAYIMSGKNKYGHASTSHLSWYENSDVKVFNCTKFYDSTMTLATILPHNVTAISKNYIVIE